MATERCGLLARTSLAGGGALLWVWLLFSLALSALGAPSRARAAGVEEAVNGNVALGRAANYVRANDFMAVWQNPANLALIPRRDAGGELRLPVYNACFDRARNPDLDYKPEESFNKVCNSKKLFPTGNFGFATSFANKLGFGVGFYTPPGIPRVNYGNDTIVTLNPFPNEQYPITKTGTESANRYLLLNRFVLAGFLMAGIGYEVAPWLRFGMSGGWGFADIKFKTVASLTGATFVDQEVSTYIKASDWAIPRFVFSVDSSPIEALDLMVQVTLTGDISAKGHLDATANGIQGAPQGDCKTANPGPHCQVNDVTLKVPYQRAEVYLGGRYAQRRPGHGRGTKLQPMRDEVWDVETNLYWVDTSNVDAFRLTLYDVPPSSPKAARIDFTSDPSGSPSPLPPNATIPHHWKNTYGLRIGGDWNVMQSFLAVRAGFSYESSAVQRPYANIDYIPLNRYGLHVGGSMRLGMITFHIAYAHIFYNQLTVPVGTGRVPEIVALDRSQAQAVNEGHYSARADILSFQSNVNF